MMETTHFMDLVAGGVALAILVGGLFMLFKGVLAFGDKDK
jgi:hypothetical protein